MVAEIPVDASILRDPEARGPLKHEKICIGEEVKIAIHLAIERFRNNETAKELEFPSSLTATERAYIHRICEDLRLRSKSTGKGSARYMVVTKKDEQQILHASLAFSLLRESRRHIHNLISRYPLSHRERQELLPRIDKARPSEATRELNKMTTGRLNNGIPQVPPVRGADADHSSIREALPIHKSRQQILDAIRFNKVALIAGETGCGKTTQVPQMILDECHQLHKQCRIFCTQPRRIAALSIAEKVASERGERIGQTVGYQIRLESKVSPKTLLTFCTNGVLLRTLMGGDAALSTVTHIIIDEIHERDRFSDFLLIAMRSVMGRFPELRIILMSAALNTDLFLKYFGGCPVVEIPTSTFEVQQYFLEDILKWTKYSTKSLERCKKELANKIDNRQQLADWCNQRVSVTNQNQEDFDLATEANEDLNLDGIDLTSDETELGVENDDLEPWLIKELDGVLFEAWTTGDDSLFSQIFHLVSSENVSVDYAHSETHITALMVASGRGFLHIVDQLLCLGANVNLKASNGWTALQWAQQFEQNLVVELLEAHVLSCESCPQDDAEILNQSSAAVVSDEDRKLLTAYQQSFNDDDVDLSLIFALISKIHSSSTEGGILVFLPGYFEIVTLRDMIIDDKKFEQTRYHLYMLHSAMQTGDQKRVFKSTSHGVRKIILATNIAETSITINDVVFVVDSGKVKEKTYDALTSVVMLKSNWISKASGKQRKGRAGRCRPGVCYHLFSRVRFYNMQEFQTPEILRYPLQELCLHTKLLAPINCPIADFLTQAPEPPSAMLLRNAVQLLMQIDALDSFEDLTELGHHLADLPVEPHLGKMLLYSVVLKCLDPILTIVCTLAYKDPFLIPSQPYQKRAAAKIRTEFAAGTYSDHMAYLRAFQSWQKARTEGWEKGFCERNFLSSACMEMIVGMRTQLLGQLRASGFVRARGGGDIRDLNTNSENWSVIKAALCAGLYPNLLRVDRKRCYLVSQRESKILFHFSSVLAPASGVSTQKKVIKSLPSDWLVYEEMTRGNAHKLAYVRCSTLLSPITVAIFAGPARLPVEYVREAEGGSRENQDPASYGVGVGSDSESEDPEDNKKAAFRLDNWINFKIDPEASLLASHLRQKWNLLLLRRIKCPTKPWSQVDEAVIRAVISILTNQEQDLGLQQPAGIGQRPRPMSTEMIMSGGGGWRSDYDHEQHGRGGGGGWGYRKTPTSSPKKSPKILMRSNTDPRVTITQPSAEGETSSPKSGTSTPGSHSNSGSNSNSLKGSASSTPCPSPGPSSPSKWVDKDYGANSTHPSRFFVMKCNNQRNLDVSQKRGIWATSVTNEKKLNRAFSDGKAVYLVFSVQGSGHFQGYAKMVSSIGKEKSPDFIAPGLSGTFSIEWVKRGNVPFQTTHHLVNSWNDNKRVQISRDGQEIEPNVGENLLKHWNRFPTRQSQNQSSHPQELYRGPREGGNGDSHPTTYYPAEVDCDITAYSGDGRGDNRQSGLLSEHSEPGGYPYDMSELEQHTPEYYDDCLDLFQYQQQYAAAAYEDMSKDGGAGGTGYGRDSGGLSNYESADSPISHIHQQGGYFYDFDNGHHRYSNEPGGGMGHMTQPYYIQGPRGALFNGGFASDSRGSISPAFRSSASSPMMIMQREPGGGRGSGGGHFWPKHIPHHYANQYQSYHPHRHHRSSQYSDY